VNYQTAHRALRALQGGSIEQEREDFRHLPAYIEILKKRDPDGDFFLSIDHDTSRFHRIFICPSSSRRIFQQGPKIFACDGTFTKNKFRQTLLFATTRDGNNEVVLLAWALVESENESAWRFFFSHLLRSVPQNPYTEFIFDLFEWLIVAVQINTRAER
jgi:hypothetical protein